MHDFRWLLHYDFDKWKFIRKCMIFKIGVESILFPERFATSLRHAKYSDPRFLHVEWINFVFCVYNGSVS